MKSIYKLGLTLFIVFSNSPAHAQDSSFSNYLENMNLKEVTFSGYIRFEDRQTRDFTYYDAEGNAFGAKLDAGRKTREEIQSKCELSGFMHSLKDMCKIQGTGTVEIDGGSILISIDQVTQLTPS